MTKKTLRFFMAFLLFILSIFSQTYAGDFDSKGETVRLHVAEVPCPKVTRASSTFSGLSKCGVIFSKKLPGLVFIGVKGGLDLLALATSLGQLEYFDAFKDNVFASKCAATDPVCQSNIRDLMRLSRYSYGWDIAAIVCSSMALLGDVMAFIWYLCDSSEKLSESNAAFPLGGSALASAGALVSTLGANGNCWTSKIYYTDNIPAPVINSLESVMAKGWPPILADFITGLPGLCVCCYIIGQSKS